MMRGCPASGRIFHDFDKTTHRCACGRWERGFAPKKKGTRPRDECQVCENHVAFDAKGHAGHHGYKRPGCGFIVGDCFGVGHKPWPAYDALEAWRVRLSNQLKVDKALLAKLPEQTVLTRMVEQRKGTTFEMERVQKTFNKPAQEFKPSESGHWSKEEHALWSAWDAWKRELAHATYELESEIKAIERERARVVKRIEKAQAIASGATPNPAKKW